MRITSFKKAVAHYGVFTSFSFSIILFTVFIASFTACAQNRETVLHGKWHLLMEQNDIGLTEIIMEFDTDADGKFEAFTRKGAVNDILGNWDALLARTFTSSFKDGSLLRIEKGVYAANQDTLQFAGILTSAIGNYAIKGYITENKLWATLSDKNHGYKGSLKGSKNVPAIPLRDYNELFRKTASLTQDKIFNRGILDSKEWKSFEKKMDIVSAKLQDDVEMIFAFYYYSGKLPISHYSLLRPVIQDENKPSAKSYRQRVFLEEKGRGTAYLKITSFDGSALEMDSIFSVIVQRDYKNLIVDLRDNPGGSVEAGMSFATHVTDSAFYGGIFLTQKYFNNHKELPTVAEYNSFPHFTESNYNLLMDGIHNTEGLCLKVIPQAPVYKGKLYILTNGATGSTCEPIVYGFKQRNRATVVGSHTAGAMLAAEMFDLGDGFKLFLPTADYYAADGYRIDKKGVEPNIKTEEDALDYVLKLVK